MTKPTTASDVANWFKDQLKLMSLITSVTSVLVVFVWYSYGQPKVKTIVKDSTDDIWTDVYKLKEDVKENNKKIKEVAFETHQTLYLMRGLAGKKAVEEMEEATEMFRPEYD